MTKLTRLLVIAVLLTRSVSAQDKELIDSLERVVAGNAHDTIKLKALGDLCWNLSFSDFDNALKYGQQELKLAEHLKDRSAIALANSDIGNVYTRVNKLDEALAYHLKAYQLRNELGLTEKAAGSLSNIAVIYKQQGNFKEAIDYMLKSLRIYEQSGDVIKQSLVMGNIASLLLDIKDLKKAKFYLDRSFRIAKDKDHPQLLAMGYASYTEYYYEKKQYDSALSYALSGLELMEAGNNISDKSLFYNTIGQIYFEKQDYKLAMEYYRKSLAIREAMGDVLGTASCNKNIGYANIKLGNYDEAKKNLDTSISLFKQIDAKDYLKETYMFMSDLYQGKKDYKQALEYYALAEEMKDVIYNEQSANKIHELQIQYETEKKENRLKLQELQLAKRNIYIGIISGAFVLSLVIAYIVYKRYRHRQELKLQKEVIRQQDIASKAIVEAEERERKRIAGDLHDGVGQLFSAVKMNLSGIASDLKFADENKKVLFDKTLDLVDESCKEVRVISHNMMPNVLLKLGLTSAVRDFINKIDHEKIKVNLEAFGLNDRLDMNIETVLYRVIQESVNNVIKHSGANQLDIQLGKDKEGIHVTIEDNGNGFDTSDLDHFEGIGLKNMRTRIGYLKGTIEWDSSAGRGTAVVIHIPSAEQAA